jgi:hypothetical protein
MSRERLQELLERARRVRMSDEDWERQRRSVAYGNTAFENTLITPEMVEEQAEKLKKENE